MSDRFPQLSPQKTYPQRTISAVAAPPRRDFRLGIPALELCLLTALALFLALA
jgi:hypothetical protein